MRIRSHLHHFSGSGSKDSRQSRLKLQVLLIIFCISRQRILSRRQNLPDLQYWFSRQRSNPVPYFFLDQPGSGLKISEIFLRYRYVYLFILHSSGFQTVLWIRIQTDTYDILLAFLDPDSDPYIIYGSRSGSSHLKTDHELKNLVYFWTFFFTFCRSFFVKFFHLWRNSWTVKMTLYRTK